IADQGAVLQAEASSIADATAVEQGLGLISAVNTQEDVSEQDAVLAGALASGSLTAADRVAFSQAAGRQQDDTMLYEELLTPAELKTYTTTMDSLAPAALRSDLATIQQAVPAGVSLRAMERDGLSPSSWQALTTTWLHGASTAGTVTASAVLTANENPAIDAKRRVWETGALGAAGLILTLLVTILLGRSINRRLTSLRRAALTLAEEQLPAVVSRLRRGASVDVAAEAPPLRAGNDEIGQVAQAIDTVRQTAIRSAVEEARLRAGLYDVFRNLARRNQSLVQRQLTLLDDMERQATDPDLLQDLFKMDHLTTRMRRHAEGLIILSGAPPGRGWSSPVRLIDVMRGAVAEIEDFARVTVSTQSTAALAGSAVTDVIHLLAELIENATTLSPPFTQVRVSGEIVGNGFAVEIEDRGLGLAPQRMAELNQRLANPPDINPANTEQLGLFVVGQLARRHGIAVTLRPSPYGGTTAVTLIPQRLIVAEGPAAITAGGSPGVASRPGAGPAGVNGGANGAYGGLYGPAGNGWSGAHQPYGPGPAGAYPAAGTYGPAESRGPGGPPAVDPARPGIRISGAVRQSGNGSAAGDGGPAGRRARHTSELPVVTGVPVSRPAASSFDVFTPLHRADAAPSSAPEGPRADDGNNPGSDGGYDEGNLGGSGSGDYKGLPRRVRQANLAPQLRSSAAAGAAPTGPTGATSATGVPRATAASLTDMRNTLSAMQRGWQQGRSQAQQDTEGRVDGD
uniref:sensor histidine kinase n=1 Tax=Trebonia sp. TaxID=2767075 RepID=UPI002629C245